MLPGLWRTGPALPGPDHFFQHGTSITFKMYEMHISKRDGAWFQYVPNASNIILIILISVGKGKNEDKL